MTDTNDILENLNVRIGFNIDSNSYREWDIELIIKEAVKYTVSNQPMPKDLKNVLCYYGIIDHFYPESTSSPSADKEETEVHTGTGGEFEDPPRSVKRARAKPR